MWTGVWNMGFGMECGLLYVIRAVVWYVRCCVVCDLLHGVWAVLRFVEFCMVYGLYGVWTFEVYM